MRKLITLGTAVCALALPAAADANHVAGAAYAGTVTTGQGGTVQVDVAPDGQSLSFQASGLGHPTNGCTGVGFGPITDVPITGHAFSISQSSGQITANGVFGQPGDLAGGAQVLNEPCTTGSQAWSAELPIAGVDAMVARSTDPALIGNDIYNLTGANQTRQWSARRGTARVFDAVFQNDGNVDGPISVDGCSSSSGFKVRYSLGGVNVTRAVENGSFESETVLTDDLFDIRTSIKVTRDARKGKTKVCKVTGDGEANRDAIKLVLKAR